MTNEELATLAKTGDQDAYSQLWEQVRRLVVGKALRVIRAMGDTRLADLDDLTQTGYLAMVSAVEQFDPETGWKFTTYLTNILKTAFADCTGFRTVRGRSDPIRYAASLDAPLSDEDEGTLSELVADPVDQMAEADERMYRQWLHDTLEEILSGLPELEEQTIRQRYYEGLTRREIGEKSGVCIETVRQWENKGLRALRKPKVLRRLDLRTDFYRRGADPVVSNVLWREELAGKFRFLPEERR